MTLVPLPQKTGDYGVDSFLPQFPEISVSVVLNCKILRSDPTHIPF